MAVFWAAETLLGVLFAGLGILWIGTEDQYLVATLVAAGLFLAMIGALMFGSMWSTVAARGPLIEMAPSGLIDRRISDQEIPWDTIRWGVVATGRGGEALHFSIAPQHARHMTFKWGSRGLAALNRLFGFPPYAIATIGTGKSLTELVDIMGQFKQPSF